MPQVFRIHGDNIVECERLAKIIIAKTEPSSVRSKLISPSVIAYDLGFGSYEWRLELLPGFNKAGRTRWEGNIFSVLTLRGSLLDETPDALLTVIDNDIETILLAIEFCGALQAGNQAWQRSGRAFSVGRSGCPFIYVVDFVKYELDPKSRVRKSLRFPTPLVPYSYISFSQATGNFVAQAYVKSEEFDRSDSSLSEFDESNFASDDLAEFIVAKMRGNSTASIERHILEKNFNIVLFLAEKSGNATFSISGWRNLHTSGMDFADFAIQYARFPFKKDVARKNQHGEVSRVLTLAKDLAVGVAPSFPFGIVAASRKREFAYRLIEIYPDLEIIERICESDRNLFFCMIKGFKPGGDDNRPDRGIQPLARMLSPNCDILTFIYGPLSQANYKLLSSDWESLVRTNGLWKAVLLIGDAVIVDSPLIGTDRTVICGINSERLSNPPAVEGPLSQATFPSKAREFHEDDVDTALHYLFAHLLNAFEGMCNPPGGDWSGLSVKMNGTESRWLSLPRVSGDVHGKRPDHMVELFGIVEKPILLIIESKEHSHDLERNVGKNLIRYIRYLMGFIPSVVRNAEWHKGEVMINPDDFEMLSAAAYLAHDAQNPDDVFKTSACDILFVLEPHELGWRIEIHVNSSVALEVRDFIISKIPPDCCVTISS